MIPRRGAIVAAALLFVICPRAEAGMNPYGYLRKLSRRIKGTTPSSEEYAALGAAIAAGKTERFLDSKIDKYVESGELVDVVTAKLRELFRLQPLSLPLVDLKVAREAGLLTPPERTQYETSLGPLFTSLIAGDRSWDELATGKDYEVYGRTRDAKGEGAWDRQSSIGFFAAAAPDQIALSNDGAFVGSLKDQAMAMGVALTPKKLKFSPSDPRVAGAITSEEFFTRYVSTSVNKGRQRAAAVMRIFLCDELVPTIPDNRNRRQAGFKLAFPENYEGAAGGKAGGLEAIHGRNAECMTCHRILDPVGRLFQTSRIVLGPMPSAGALVYDDDNHKQITIPVAGLGAFADALVRQPKYADCQVRHFWDWFVASDIDPDEALKRELASEFDTGKRRAKAFVKYLVKRPEFQQGPVTSNGPVTFASVAPTLARCNSCHNPERVPPFSRLPFENGLGDHAYWLGKIRERMDLPDGDSKKMPPAMAHWEASDVARIRKWLEEGARDPAGERTLR